jgi:hypothetical protein
MCFLQSLYTVYFRSSASVNINIVGRCRVVARDKADGGELPSMNRLDEEIGDKLEAGKASLRAEKAICYNCDIL